MAEIEVCLDLVRAVQGGVLASIDVQVDAQRARRWRELKADLEDDDENEGELQIVRASRTLLFLTGNDDFERGLSILHDLYMETEA